EGEARAKVQAQENEQQAVEQRQRAEAAETRAKQEAAVARAVNEFLQEDLLGQADIGKQRLQGAATERNPNITVRELLGRAAGAVEKRFVGQPLTEAAIRQTLGTTYWRLGRYAEAQAHLVRSVGLRSTLLGGDHPDTLVSKNDLALVYLGQGKYDLT